MTPQLCAVHGEAPSVGACARCGRFACEACWGVEDGLCVDCRRRLADAYGLRAANFDVLSPFGPGWRLFRDHLGTVAAIGAIIGAPVILFSVPDTLLLRAGQTSAAALFFHDLRRALPQCQNLYDTFVVLFARLAVLCVFIAAAEGRSLGVRSALREGSHFYGRALWARFRAALWVLLFALLLLVPGIWRGVSLAFVTVAAVRTREDPVELSQSLVNGRWWRVFAFLFLGGLAAYLPWVVLGGVLAVLNSRLLLGPLPLQVATVLSDTLGDALFSALCLSAFYQLHQSHERELPPMRWRTPPPFRSP